MATLSINEICTLMHRHWTFRLFDRFPDASFATVAITLSGIIFALGAVISSLSGYWRLYLLSLIPYVHFAGFTLGLIAFGWWRKALAAMIVRLNPAVNLSDKALTALVRSWDSNWLNSLGAACVFTIPFVLLNGWDTYSSWAEHCTQKTKLAHWLCQAMGGSWAETRSLALECWYVILHAVLNSFMLGSGLAGLFATMTLIKTTLDRPIRLAYYRHLDAPVNLGTRLTGWVLVAVPSVALFSRPMASQLLTPLAISTLVQVVIASAASILTYWRPLALSRSAIRRAKDLRILILEPVAEDLYARITAISQKPHTNETDPRVEELACTHSQMAKLKSLIKFIEDTPESQVAVASRLKLAGGFLVSTFSPLLVKYLSTALGIAPIKTP